MSATLTLSPPKTGTRVSSIDVLRGLVMIMMALDHTRDYVHVNGLFYNPLDLATTSPILFATRWLTHFCAPAFVFLAGSAARLSGQKKTLPQLSQFLLSRGLWLILLEIGVMNFAFWFDTTFAIIELQVIWAIGVSMVVLAGLVHLPKRWILAIGIAIVVGHNAFDSLRFSEGTAAHVIWSLLHHPATIPLLDGMKLSILYPVLPWVGVISLGYCFGEIYERGFSSERRKKILQYLGAACLLGFFCLRALNVYGDPQPWSAQANATLSMMSFLNVSKYPPSLPYTLVTLGVCLLFLRWIEGKQTRLLNFFTVYGRVPLFYYVLHFYLIHAIAVVGVLLAGVSWAEINFQNGTGGISPGQGQPLATVYVIWMLIVAGFYPLCQWYHRFKSQQSHSFWSYL